MAGLCPVTEQYTEEASYLLQLDRSHSKLLAGRGEAVEVLPVWVGGGCGEVLYPRSDWRLEM